MHEHPEAVLARKSASQLQHLGVVRLRHPAQEVVKNTRRGRDSVDAGALAAGRKHYGHPVVGPHHQIADLDAVRAQAHAPDRGLALGTASPPLIAKAQRLSQRIHQAEPARGRAAGGLLCPATPPPLLCLFIHRHHGARGRPACQSLLELQVEIAPVP